MRRLVGGVEFGHVPVKVKVKVVVCAAMDASLTAFDRPPCRPTAVAVIPSRPVQFTAAARRGLSAVGCCGYN